MENTFDFSGHLILKIHDWYKSEPHSGLGNSSFKIIFDRDVPDSYKTITNDFRDGLCLNIIDINKNIATVTLADGYDKTTYVPDNLLEPGKEWFLN